jgi:alpha-glucosidase (family GH31 glycosyl hydrolase)
MLNGCPLTSCDLTSPDATTLVRQYQSAVFTPIMRVHMMQGTPRFPWFWPDSHSSGFEEHQDAFQAALRMRYSFLPFLYSLAHSAYREGRPIAHPASFAFPASSTEGGDGEGESDTGSTAEAAAAAAQYMVGSVLIPSDLGGLAHTNERPPPLENNSIVHLPRAGRHWYRWNSTVTEAGGQMINETLGLSEMAVFVREGALLPLHANASIQHTGEIGGLLELQVYAGRDGHFVMVEDDGISEDYQQLPKREGTHTRHSPLGMCAACSTDEYS